MIRLLLMTMPLGAFAGASRLVAAALGDAWFGLTRAHPELAAAH